MFSFNLPDDMTFSQITRASESHSQLTAPPPPPPSMGTLPHSYAMHYFNKYSSQLHQERQEGGQYLSFHSSTVTHDDDDDGLPLGHFFCVYIYILTMNSNRKI